MSAEILLPVGLMRYRIEPETLEIWAGSLQQGYAQILLKDVLTGQDGEEKAQRLSRLLQSPLKPEARREIKDWVAAHLEPLHTESARLHEQDRLRAQGCERQARPSKPFHLAIDRREFLGKAAGFAAVAASASFAHDYPVAKYVVTPSAGLIGAGLAHHAAEVHAFMKAANRLEICIEDSYRHLTRQKLRSVDHRDPANIPPERMPQGR